MQPKTIERYFFLGLLLATLVFTFLIFRPFWILLVLGVSFSIVLYPVYSWLKKRKFPNWLASLGTVFLFIILLCVPLFAIGSILLNQSQDLYQAVLGNGGQNHFMTSLGREINNFLPRGITIDMSEKVSELLSFISSHIANIFSATFSILFSFALLLLTIFYFLKDGENWRKTLIKLSPLSDDDDQKIIDRVSLTVNGVIKGYLLIVFIQGGLMGIGLAIFQVPNAVLFGVVAGLASLIPSIGTALVAAPAVIFLFATGHTGLAIGMLIWAALIVGMADNVLNPYIIGNKLDVPPFLILFSILGGISLWGLVGILIGPLAVSLLYTLTEIYRTEFKQS